VSRPDFQKADYDRANILLAQIDWILAFAVCADADECYQQFLDILYFVIAECVPFRLTRGRPTEYPTYVRHAQAEKRRLWRLRHLPGGRIAYARASLLCSKAISRFQRAIERQIVLSKDRSKFFRYIKNQTKTKPAVSPLRNASNVLCTSDVEKANILQDQFVSVFTIDNGIVPPFQKMTHDKLKYVLFPADVVYAHLCNLKDQLSCTPDNLPSFFLKRVALAVAAPLSHIYSLSFMSGIVPKAWRTAIVVPIFKKGPTDRAVNYRPISLTCVNCRVMERIISASIIAHILSWLMNSLVSCLADPPPPNYCSQSMTGLLL
jgi:hypothetical protein